MSPDLRVLHWSDKAKMALIGLLTTLVVVLSVTALALGLSALSDRRALHQAHQALKQAVSAHQLAQVVNAERAASIGQSCTDQNARHDNTISALQVLYRQKLPIVKLPGVSTDLATALAELRAAQARASRAPTLLLINALVPRQDCRQLVKTSTTPPGLK